MLLPSGLATGLLLLFCSNGGGEGLLNDLIFLKFLGGYLE